VTGSDWILSLASGFVRALVSSSSRPLGRGCHLRSRLVTNDHRGMVDTLKGRCDRTCLSLQCHNKLLPACARPDQGGGGRTQ
jgi:hypothetical protein